MCEFVFFSRNRSLNLANVCLIVGLLTGLFTATISAGETIVRDVFIESDFINAILEANADESDNLHVINLNGQFTFTKPYNESISNSPLPEMADDNFLINVSDTTTINYEPEGGDSGDVVLFKLLGKLFEKPEPDRGMIIFKSFFFIDPFPEGQFHDASPDSANNPSVKAQAQAQEPVFNGFDKLVEASNTTVTMIGINAECGTTCVDLDNSKLVVLGSRLTCDEECIRARDPGANETAIDYTSFKDGAKESGLPPAEISNLLTHLDRAEQLLSNYDIGIVQGDLRSRFATVSVTRSDLTIEPARVRVDKSTFSTSASSYRALQIKSAGDENLVTDTVLSGPDSRRELLDVVYGTVTARNLFIDRGTKAIAVADGSVNLGLSAISTQGRNPEDAVDVCDFTFRTDAVNSDGYNIVTDESCELDGPGDQESTDPGLELPGDGSLIPRFTANSPAIDGGPSEVSGNQLPCSTTDMTGLPRPQDGDGDGVAECDVGPVELRAGVDIGPAQSGAFYDSGRDGEGVFVEMIGNGKAVVYLFSYTPDGSGAFWAVGLGNVVGNGIVMTRQEFITTSGGIFGENFDPARVEQIPFADISISFPDCDNKESAGVLAIEPNSELGFGPLFSRTNRLASVLTCAEAPEELGPGFSGSHYDPTHDGEGIIVEVVSADRAVIMWFTFDSKGNQQWILGVGDIVDNTITVTDAFTQTGPNYGPDFDKGDRVEKSWGDFSVVFETNCNKSVLNYESEHAEYGSGTLNLQRLSKIEGLDCGQ